MSITPEPTNLKEASTASPPRVLPPEVEAELRRRQTAAAPAAPWLQPAAREGPDASPPPSPASASPEHTGKGESLRRLGPIGMLLATLLKYLPLLLKFGLVVL